MSEQEDIKRLYLDPADRDLLRAHLVAERKRLPEGTRPLHGPDCYLCVAGYEKAYLDVASAGRDPLQNLGGMNEAADLNSAKGEKNAD